MAAPPGLSFGQDVSVWLYLHVRREKHLQHSANFGRGKRCRELALNLSDHFAKSDDRGWIAIERRPKWLVIFPGVSVPYELCDSCDMREALGASTGSMRRLKAALRIPQTRPSRTVSQP